MASEVFTVALQWLRDDFGRDTDEVKAIIEHDAVLAAQQLGNTSTTTEPATAGQL
jgi:hypothetical protein